MATPVKKINHLKLFLQKKTASAKSLSGCPIEVMLKTAGGRVSANSARYFYKASGAQ